jgi:3-phenylpropionate/trans-cinnamate dioxygenase ferredoxin reductase component
MSKNETFVIIGAGLAGAKAAETLRREGFAGRVVLIGGEMLRPYERPPLSKDYLRGEIGRDRLFVHDEDFYDSERIELRLGRAIHEVIVESSEVVFGDDERLHYSRLLLTTGSRPRHLGVPGGELAGVHYLRTANDSDALRARFGGCGHLVVIGAGWIGSEVAASARGCGLDVTMIAPDRAPLAGVLGADLGSVYRDLHRDHGVRMLLGTRVAALEGRTTVERVRTSDGHVVSCDAVVVGIGAEPRTRLASQARIAVENGILADEHLETNVPGVFAAGDVANAFHPFYGARVRVEHWANALNQGPIAAESMLGRFATYDRLPYFYSDQYDVGMEYTGHAPTWDRIVFRGDPSTRSFIAFWLLDGRVAAGMNVNAWEAATPIERLIRSRTLVDDRLADPDVPLEHLVPDAQRSDA